MYPELFTIPNFKFWDLSFDDYAVRSYGLMLMIGFFSAAWIAARRAEKVKASPDVVLNCAIFALIGSMVGARLFYVLHYWDEQFAGHPNPIRAALDISKGGMELFGGILGATILIVGYLVIKRESLRLYLDILTPGLMWGIAFGRLGCFLNGCCWGAVCTGTVAENWAVTFPYGSPAYYRHYSEGRVKVPAELLQMDRFGRYAPLPREQVFMDPGQRNQPERKLAEAKQVYEMIRASEPDSPELENAKKRVERYQTLAQLEDKKLESMNKILNSFPSAEFPGQTITPSELADLAHASHSLPVQPAQLYAVINAFLAAGFLAILFRVRRHHGVVFAVWLCTYPWTRIILEQIRSDNPLDTFGMTVSSALSIAMVAIGIVLMVWLRRLPPRSPYAREWIPPQPREKTAKT